MKKLQQPNHEQIKKEEAMNDLYRHEFEKEISLKDLRNQFHMLLMTENCIHTGEFMAVNDTVEKVILRAYQLDAAIASTIDNLKQKFSISDEKVLEIKNEVRLGKKGYTYKILNIEQN